MADKTSDSDQPVVIKKYANRRLYNTSTSSYVTLDYLCQMVKDDIDFVVLDARGMTSRVRSSRRLSSRKKQRAKTCCP